MPALIVGSHWITRSSTALPPPTSSAHRLLPLIRLSTLSTTHLPYQQYSSRANPGIPKKPSTLVKDRTALLHRLLREGKTRDRHGRLSTRSAILAEHTTEAEWEAAFKLLREKTRDHGSTRDRSWKLNRLWKTLVGEGYVSGESIDFSSRKDTSTYQSHLQRHPKVVVAPSTPPLPPGLPPLPSKPLSKLAFLPDDNLLQLTWINTEEPSTTPNTPLTGATIRRTYLALKQYHLLNHTAPTEEFFTFESAVLKSTTAVQWQSLSDRTIFPHLALISLSSPTSNRVTSTTTISSTKLRTIKDYVIARLHDPTAPVNVKKYLDAERACLLLSFKDLKNFSKNDKRTIFRVLTNDGLFPPPPPAVASGWQKFEATFHAHAQFTPPSTVPSLKPPMIVPSHSQRIPPQMGTFEAMIKALKITMARLREGGWRREKSKWVRGKDGKGFFDSRFRGRD